MLSPAGRRLPTRPSKAFRSSPNLAAGPPRVRAGPQVQEGKDVCLRSFAPRICIPAFSPFRAYPPTPGASGPADSRRGGRVLALSQRLCHFSHVSLCSLSFRVFPPPGASGSSGSRSCGCAPAPLSDSVARRIFLSCLLSKVGPDLSFLCAPFQTLTLAFCLPALSPSRTHPIFSLNNFFCVCPYHYVPHTHLR